MAGPSVAPVLVALGAFVLLFGLFSSGIWLWIGCATLAVGLVLWGREALLNR
jgi:membrane-bound ClpP family serine protease